MLPDVGRGNTMTVTEDLALLLHDPVTGKGVVDGTALPRGLAGAAVLDLVLAGHARVDGEGWRAQLEIVDRTPVHPVLDAAAARLIKPVRPKRAIERLSGTVRDAVMAHLVGAGVVRDDGRRVLGLLPDRRWPAVDRGPGDLVRGRVRAILVDGVAPEQHDAAVVSLLHAVRAEHKVVEGKRSELRRRGKEVADGEWAGAAVRKAINDIHVAVAAAVTAGAASSSG